MKQRIVIAWFGIVGSLLLGVVSAFIVTNQTLPFRVTMGLSVAAALLNLLAIPFFIIGLKHFKIRLQHAYTLLCIGIGIFGLAQVQLPLITLYNLGFWLDSGAIALPYLVGVVCIFLSMRALSKLLNITSLGRSIGIALLATIILSLDASYLPHVAIMTDELTFHISLALSIWNSVFITFAALLALKIRLKIGKEYAHSVNWLFAALSTLAFAGWHYTVTQLVTMQGEWYYDFSISILPFIAGALLFVIAGYTFDEINSVGNSARTPSTPTKNTPPMHAPASILNSQQELDIVLYVANLVSNPTDIDLVLDRVRDITSRLQPGEQPSPSDRETLKKVYEELEDYLLHQDPLRVFTREELRGRISKRFTLNGVIKTNLWDNHPTS